MEGRESSSSGTDFVTALAFAITVINGGGADNGPTSKR
jgi:hypothetical protein